MNLWALEQMAIASAERAWLGRNDRCDVDGATVAWCPVPGMVSCWGIPGTLYLS